MEHSNDPQLPKYLMATAAAAHDLRELCAVILAAHDLLERQCIVQVSASARKQAEQPLQFIARSVQKMERISMNLMDVSRCSSGTLQPRWEALCLSDVCSQLCEEARARLAPVQTLRVRLPRQPIVLHTGPYFFDRILLNLLSNAICFCRQGVITVILKPADDGVVLVVEDEGPGLPPDRLADPFAPEMRDWDGGARLGLYICQLLATGLGGTLTVENMPRQGARFVLRLPEPALEGVQELHETDPMLQNQHRAKQVQAEFSVLPLPDPFPAVRF